MRLWVDDIREAPKGYVWCRSVGEAKFCIKRSESVDINGKKIFEPIELIDIDHDAGNYVYDGGDYIKLLGWLEETNRNYPIRIHSMNPVGRENMRNIIRRNNWIEVY